MKVDVNSVFFALAGIFYFLIFSISGFQVLYVPILGVLFLIAAVGLYLKIGQGFTLAILLLPVGFVFGAIALIASALMSSAFSQSAYTLFNGLMLLYLVASIYFSYRLIKGREDYLGSGKTESTKK
jgi:hypothetical protein